MFQNVHPEGNNPRPLDSRSVNYGRNADNPHTGLRDDGYVKCGKCGFMCHLDRDARAPRRSATGLGVTLSTSYGGWGSDAWGSAPWGGGFVGTDPIVTSGCPFCGTYLYAG